MKIIAKIIAHETGINNKIYYLLEVYNQNTQHTKISKLRYSQFRQIHQQINKIVSKHKLHILLPQFPSKKIFSSTNKSQQKIDQRKKQLTQVCFDNYIKYLSKLLSIQKLRCLQIMKKYYIPNQNQTTQKTPYHSCPIQICIDRYTLVQNVVIYYVRIKDLKDNQQWTFKTRYSELRNVHDALIEAKIKNIPQFPKKKMFGVTNQNPEDIERRREQLQKYFNQIFRNNQVMKSQTLRYFVQQSKKQAAKDKQLQQIKKKAKQC